MVTDLVQIGSELIKKLRIGVAYDSIESELFEKLETKVKQNSSMFTFY